MLRIHLQLPKLMELRFDSLVFRNAYKIGMKTYHCNKASHDRILSAHSLKDNSNYRTEKKTGNFKGTTYVGINLKSFYEMRMITEFEIRYGNFDS